MVFGKSYRVRLKSFSTAGIAILLLLFIFSMSCGTSAPSQSPTVPEPMSPSSSPSAQPSPQLPSVGEWVADGVISEREYIGEGKYGDYEIRWTSDEEYIYVAMKAKTSGWVAIGVQPGSRMMDADIILGFVKDGKTAVYDLFSTGDYGPHPPDAELGGTNDILEFEGKEEGGYTIIEFKRALDTGDEYDKPLASGSNKIIWSYGSDDSLTLKHVNRGYGELEL